MLLALPAQALSPLGVNIKLIGAINRGDAEAVAALFTEDGSLQDPPDCTPCVGRAAIMKDFENVAAAGFHVNADNREWTEDTFKADFTATAPVLRDVGVHRIMGSYWFHTVGDLIDRMVVTLDASDPQTARFLASGPGGGDGSPTRLPATGDGSLPASNARSAGVSVAFGAITLAVLLRRRLA
jgi:hypothetical protein